MTDATTEKRAPTTVQTTGHAWDGDLQEFNNPLPRWWLWSFYATVVFALVYWVLFPAWPIGDSWTRGTAETTILRAGEEVEVPWNTRYELIANLQSSNAALRQQEFTDRVAAVNYEEILNNPEMMAFARSVGNGLFGDNCAACHGRGGEGVVGLFPNLADDDWLWGGTPEKIHETLVNGRNGFMPAFGPTFGEKELNAVAEYVLSLSGEVESSAESEHGRELFQGSGGGCYYCHGEDGQGLQSQGAANLTDRIWTVAPVPAQESVDDKRAVVANVILNGVMGNRVMPAFNERLSATDLKLLTVYVLQLGGGQ